MRRLFLLLFILVLTLQEITAKENDTITHIDRLFAYLAENSLFSGVAFVSEGGEIIYKSAFGYANFEWEIPNTLDSRFQIGSISKQFTAMLVMQLVGEGKLSLSDPVSKYLPELPPQWADQVTIHHMLSHTSGVPNYTLLPDYVQTISKTRYTRTEFFDLLLSSSLLDTLHFDAGASFDYSNTNYFFMGLIIERIDEKPLESVFQEKIFDPLGMTNTGAFDDQRYILHRAYGYEKSPDDTYEPALPFAISPKSLPSGGLYSTVTDLYRWHEGIRNHTILNKSLTATYLSPHYEFSETEGYAYGNYYTEYSVDDTHTLVVFEHGGSLPGTTCMFLRIPEADQCIVLLHNGGMGRESFLSLVAHAIIDVLYGKRLEIPRFDLLGPLGYTVLKKDASAIRAHYVFLKENRSDVYEFNPQQLSMIGNLVVQFLNDSVKAEVLFQLNTEEYPNEALVHTDLGKFYLDNGDGEKALRFLQKASKLSQDDEELQTLLERAEKMAERGDG
jgi:CubicO group peptidase (beta-lactamase class C family)